MPTVSLDPTRPNQCNRYAVVVGDPLIIAVTGRFPTPLTLRAMPGASGTLVINYQMGDGSGWAAFTDGTLTGDLSANAADMTYAAISAIRVTAATANGEFSIGW